jgi:hypothetical protein
MTRGSITGAVAAAVAVSLGELVTAVSTSGPSLMGAVGDGFINLWGSQLKDLAVTIFGSNHKLALTIGMILVVVGLGALLGHLGEKRSLVPRIGWVLAGLL